MKRLTQKTFILFLALSLFICVTAYVSILLFLPYADKKQEESNLCEKADQLVIQLRQTKKNESETFFAQFIKETGAEIFLADSHNNVYSVFTFQPQEQTELSGSQYPFRFADSREEYILFVQCDEKRVKAVMEAVGKSIPVVIGLTILLSTLSAFLFSKYTTDPIIRINEIARHIADLDFSWYCPDIRDDEIGKLSDSINTLSDKLHDALKELYRRNDFLEEEIKLEKEQERRRMLFFSGVSHELKTPIAIVIGQLEGMQAGIGVYKDRDKYLNRSTEILQSLNEFIKQVLMISHLNMTVNTKLQSMNLSKLVESMIHKYDTYIETFSFHLTIHIDTDIQILGDEMLLRKALENIVGNAFTYTPDGGNVRIELMRRNGNIEFTVINSPAHIPEESLPHIFEAFYRINQTENEGSGLGLYITKIILETYHISHSVMNTDQEVRFIVTFEEVSRS